MGPRQTACLSVQVAPLQMVGMYKSGDGGKPPPAICAERSPADRPEVAFSSACAVASWKLISYTRAIPRLLPQFAPPAVAEGWLVPKKVVPATVMDDPTVFSPEPSVSIQPLALRRLLCAASCCVLPGGQRDTSCKQSLVESNRSASVIGAAGLMFAGSTSVNLRSLNM